MHIAKFINKHLIVLLIGVIGLGLFLGYLFPEGGQALEMFYPVSLFLMLYPMMVDIKINDVVSASTRVGFMAVVMILNYIVAPLLSAFLGHMLLAGYPDFAIGLIINGTVPCGGMIVAWTVMSRGNAPMTLVITVLSLLAGIALIPFWIWILAGQYVPIDAWKMLQTILYTIIVPLLLGNLTRNWLVNKWGQERFNQTKPIFPAASAMGLFMVFFIAMMSQSVILLENPHYWGIVALPLLIFYVLLFSITILYARLTRISYPDMVSLFYGVVGKNASIALALAVIFFSPLTVLLLAVKPLVQISFLTTFHKLSPYLEKRWHNIVQPKDVPERL